MRFKDLLGKTKSWTGDTTNPSVAIHIMGSNEVRHIPTTPDFRVDTKNPRATAAALFTLYGKDFADDLQEALYELLNPEY